MPKAAEAKAMAKDSAKDSAGDSVRHFINLAKAYEIRVSCAERRANHVAYNQGMQHRSTKKRILRRGIIFFCNLFD